MALLLLLLAVIVGILVGDLVLENPAADVVTVLQHPISGYSQGQLLAAVAALGFVLGLLMVGAASLRRTRRARRRQLRTAERDLTAQLTKLERENASLREELADRDRPLAVQLRRPGQAISTAPGRPRWPRARPGSSPCRPTAPPSRSTSRPGGPPTSAAVWTDDVWPPGPLMLGSSFPELLAAAQSGDEQAFAVLWRHLQPALLRYFRIVAPPAAEDLAADTWLSVIRRLQQFRGDERAFRAWLFTVARHRAIDWRRQAARRPTTLVPVEQLAERAAPDDPVAQVLEGQSTRAALALLAGLPADQAEVVALRVLGGLEVAEVARILGKRPGAVRVLAHRGLRRLAKLLKTADLARAVTR